MKKIPIKLWIYASISVVIMAVIFCFSCQTGESSCELSKKFFDKMKDNGIAAFTPKITLVQSDEAKNSEDKDKKAEKEDTDKESGIVLRERKWAHVYLYALLGVFVSLTALELKKAERIKHLLTGLLGSVGVCLLYACSDEFHQHFVEGRTASFKDVLFDSIGFVITIAIVFAVWSIIHLMHRRKI